MNRALLQATGLALVCAASATPSIAQQGDGTEVPIRTNVFKPNKVDATPERVAQIKAPPGFAVSVFANGLKNARILAVAPDGTVYLSRRDQGDILMFKDANGDGRADGPPVQVASRAGLHGMAIRDGKMYIVTVKELFVAPIRSDGSLGQLDMLLGDLPDAGQHANRTLAFGPDGMLYISVGSTCNACNEANPENATMLRVSPDGKSRTIMASGLRNTIGFDWNPQTGEMWGMDHGIDFLGDEIQPEELNKIETGKQYGWPHIWGDGGVNPQSTPIGDISKAQWKAISTPMVLGYAAHAAPMQMLFYKASQSPAAFPGEYRGDAFVTMRGSWNRNPAAGYEIVRIRFADGQAKAIEPFVTGFLTDNGRTHIARPVGLAVARDGALLMADDANGVIYRIAYTGARRTAATAAPAATSTSTAAATAAAPATAMQAQAARGNGVPLASKRDETRPANPTAAMITLSSTAFANNAAIPARHSEYADGVSPALAWTPVDGARSYAIVVEDPDAKPATPFVHWVAWNIPAAFNKLPEGLQEQARLTEPDGVLQGRTTRGSAGYYGPKPPVGDKPHHYHFQIFALDSLLDLPPGADRDQVLTAMKGHVIGRGVLVGTYRQLVQPPK